MSPDTQRVLDEIRAERNRQIAEEGWNPAHDDGHRNGEMAGAAACYAMVDLRIGNEPLKKNCTELVADLWPWAKSWWKPTAHRRNLLRAAALLVAEIERLDRASIARMAARFEEPGVVVYPEARERAP